MKRRSLWPKDENDARGRARKALHKYLNPPEHLDRHARREYCQEQSRRVRMWIKEARWIRRQGPEFGPGGTIMTDRSRRARLAQKQGDAGEAEIVQAFKPLIGLRHIRSRKRLEAGNVATGADSEIDDPGGQLHLLIQRKNRKHTNVPAAWREISTADGRRSDQIPVVWASWRGKEQGRRVTQIAILRILDAEIILRRAGWTDSIKRASIRGRSIPVVKKFIEHRTRSARVGKSIAMLILDYPSLDDALVAIDWSIFVEAWDLARQQKEE